MRNRLFVIDSAFMQASYFSLISEGEMPFLILAFDFYALKISFLSPDCPG